MDINKTINDIRQLEESEEYKRKRPEAIERKERLDKKISRFIWE